MLVDLAWEWIAREIGTGLALPSASRRDEKLGAAAELSLAGARGEASLGDLAADCAARLRARLAQPQRAPGDWSAELPAGICAYELCDTARVASRTNAADAWQVDQGEWPMPLPCLPAVMADYNLGL